MKKSLILVLIAFISITGYSQKKKKSGAKKASTTALAKVDNLAAEIKSGNFQITISDKGKPVDAIIVKSSSGNFSPTNTKLMAFTANGSKLYLLSWTENNTNKTDLKTENIVANYTNIYEITSKKQVFTNTQQTANITEKVFLDRLKNASETQQKVRREGFEVTLNPDGSITERSKNQEQKLVYDATKMEYVVGGGKKK